MAEKKRKYLLFNRADGRPDSLKPCAFFFSPAGCRNGDKCPFSHTNNPESVEAVSSSNTITTGVVSHANSNTESREENPRSNKKKKVTTQSVEQSAASVDPEIARLKEELERQKKLYEAAISAKASGSSSSSNAVANRGTPAVKTVPIAKLTPVAKPAPVKATPIAKPAGKLPATEPNIESDSSSDDDDRLLFDAVNFALADGRRKSGEPMKTMSSIKAERVAQPDSSDDELSAEALPVLEDDPFVDSSEALKSLQTSKSKHALYGPLGKQAATKEVKVEKRIVEIEEGPKFDPSTVSFKKLDWKKLVDLTLEHPKFAKDYNLLVDSTWVKSQPVDAKSALDAYKVLSIDCEMCETTDPVDSTKDTNALIRFSVINAMKPAEVIIDQLVHPSMPISESRTHIHGIQESDLASVSYTLRQAQATLLKICKESTIIIGHSLHNDLKALKFDHRCVIDTSYLFNVADSPHSAASIRDISDQLLGMKLPGTHDSVQDAQAALYAAALLLVKGPQKSILRSNGTSSSNGNSDNDNCKLLVHRIPDSCTEEQIKYMMIKNCQIVPTKLEPINRGTGGATGKCNIYFTTERHAQLAFESIAGPNRPDKQNRPQKRIYLRGGGYICVRF